MSIDCPGGDWGASIINDKFLNQLQEMFGTDLMVRDMSIFEFMCNFLNEALHSHHGIQMPAKFERFLVDQGLRALSGMIAEKKETLCKVIQNLFDEIIAPIVRLCVDILERPEMEDAMHIFLVGKFAHLKYFQMKMRGAFTNYKGLSIEIPDLPELCVVDGAARYGLNRNFVISQTTAGATTCAVHLHNPQRHSLSYILPI